MLKTLSVKNFAVIDDLHVEFGQGLNVFSGETGAGKSVLVGALGFALGGRASAVVIRSGAGRMEVSAVFSSESLGAALRAKYAISGETFTLRRELDCKGRGRAYVNGSPVSVSVLADIGAGLVDFHGQHDHQTLLKPSVHLELLDRFGGLEKAVDEIRLLVRKLRELENRLQSQAMSKEEKERLLDLYRFQADEIAGAHLRAGEDAEIAERLPRLKNAEKLASLSGQAYALLYADEGSAVEKAGAAIKLVSELAEIDAGFNSAADMLNGALAQLEEVSSEISACAKGIVSDSAELDSVLARDENIKRLKMKYGPDIPDVLNRQEELKRKIDDLDFSDLKEGEIRTEMESVRRKLVPLCAKLHDARMKAGEKLSKLILAQIRPLGFAGVEFSVSVEMDETDIRENGADKAEFLFTANEGSPLMPLKDIASGGEMSRVMLGLKTVLAGADRVPVLVFDEVDAGIGGETGSLVGEKLARIGKAHQVLCVTHLATVAAYAGRHFRVEKTLNGKAARTEIAQLEGEGRVSEIARMLGGKDVRGAAAVNHARELLRECAA